MKAMIRADLRRRDLLLGGIALGGFALAGCARSGSDGPSGQNMAATGAGAERQAAMTVYRDPSCGCCEAWATQAQQAGYQVSLLDEPDMARLKQRLGVPGALASCHTAIVGDFVLEGHVPFAHVAKLLREQPRTIRGLAVPGMPIGSPGMEAPDGRVEPFDVIAFDKAGGANVYRA